MPVLSVYLLYCEDGIRACVAWVHPEVHVFTGHPFCFFVYMNIGPELSEHESLGR